MSRKRVNRSLLAGAFTVCISIIISCKEKRAFNEENAQATVDERMAQGENDEVVKDANTVIMEQYLLRGSKSSGAPTPTTSICGVTLDTSLITTGVIRLIYKGTNCYGRIRTGTVRITVQGYPLKKWKHPGAVLKLEFQGYKVQRTSDNKTVQLDGVQYLTNESGNTWYELWFLNQATVVQTHTGNDMNVRFQNEGLMFMSVNRRITYTFSDWVTTFKVEGLGSQDGRNHLQSWGETRDGKKFTAEVVSPVIWKTSCGGMAPVAGEVHISVDEKEYELRCQYGVDKKGEALSGDDKDCPYGWKVSWSRKKKTNTRVFSYY